MGLSSFVERTIDRVKRSPVDFALLHPEAVPGNLVTGAAGVAYFLYEVARLRDDPRALVQARAWAAAARKWANRAKPEAWRWSTNGFLNGAGGLAFMEALLGDTAALTSVGMPTVHLQPTSRAELYGGVGGKVALAAVLASRLGDSRALGRLAQTRLPPSKTPLLGMAHGRAGELWSQVLARGPNDAGVKADLDALFALRRTDVNGLVYWMPTADSDDTSLLDTWCHGMTGHSLLWTAVARRAPTKRNLVRARQAAETAAVFRAPQPSLCCGLAGQSLALQRYADLTGDARFARRAYVLLDRATRAIEAPVWHKVQHGLWQGALGVALAALLRLHGESAFPVIEPLEPLSGE